MTLRGSTTVKDRILACLPYLLPLIDVLGFGSVLFSQFPALGKAIVTPLLPIILIYTRVPLASLIIFFVLFLLVVRNDKISHFIRFNTMQAILLKIVVILGSILLEILARIPGAIFGVETLESTLFLGIAAAVFYSVFQSLFGRYAEIPAISEAVYTQVR